MEMQPFVKAHREENNTSNEKVQEKRAFRLRCSRVIFLQDRMQLRQRIEHASPVASNPYKKSQDHYHPM